VQANSPTRVRLADGRSTCAKVAGLQPVSVMFAALLG
jgi:hypothetical protein